MSELRIVRTFLVLCFLIGLSFEAEAQRKTSSISAIDTSIALNLQDSNGSVAIDLSGTNGGTVSFLCYVDRKSVV